MVLYGIAILALWYLFRPYTGIIHDSTIYVGRALADLYPSSIGQQLSYAYDGQSQFSIARKLFGFLIGRFGANTTAISLTAIGLAFWISAATFLLSRLLGRRLLLAALLCLCAMPSAYGGNWVFHWAEPFATPRLFSEAASLVAIGLLIDRHLALAFVFFVAAFVLHPIMVLPALGVAFILLCQTNIRWLWGGAAVGVLVVIAAAAGIPLLDRLFVYPDSTWLAIIHDETKQVLLSDWYAASWSLAGCQLVTVALAWHSCQGTIRRIVMAGFIVAALGIVAPVVWPSLLILQAQTWRALWLLSFFAIALLPLLVTELWKKGKLGQASVALLLAAWMLYAESLWAAPALVAALVLAVVKVDRPIPRWVLFICWGLGFAALEFFLSTTVPQAVSFYRLLPDGIYGFSPDSVGFGFQFPILVGLAVAIALGWAPRLDGRARVAVWIATVFLSAVAVTHWDRRSRFSQALDAGADASALRAKLPSGDVFWLSGYVGNMSYPAADGWLWTGRPSWWDGEQGAGVVFDRTLAIETYRRVQLLRKAGLLDKAEDKTGTQKSHPQLITQNVLNKLCVVGGPDWIVAPINQTVASVRTHAAGKWRAPAPTYMWDTSRKQMVSLETYLILNCEVTSLGR